MSVNAGEKVHLEVLRGQERLAIRCTRDRTFGHMDQISSLAIRKKIWFGPLGILGSKSTKKVAAMAPDLRDPFGIIVLRVPATRGLKFRSPETSFATLNGQPMTRSIACEAP